jgi:hypothetical protein
MVASIAVRDTRCGGVPDPFRDLSAAPAEIDLGVVSTSEVDARGTGVVFDPDESGRDMPLTSTESEDGGTVAKTE